MSEPQIPGPAALRIKLGATLRRLREARGITAQQAAKAIRGSDSKISRIELGRHAAREIDVVDLLALYGVTDPGERDELLALASAALAAPWWQRHNDVLPAWMQTYLGLEEAAESVECYDTHFVPGLLQTSDYAASLIAMTDLTEHQAAGLLAVRAERIERFAAAGRRLDAVIDEAVLRRPVPDASVLPAQLRYLRDAAARPGVSVRIRRLSAGAPPAPAGFTILRFADADLPDMVYSEQLTNASYLDKPAEVSRYAAAMSQLAATSEPAARTAAILDAELTALG
ncbi:MAG TPA: helix-turn-helix transcriptional regulator [Streptosporangiaceae bacterium]|nr:helix-turn-helix transcriptional regulator [Streptosporangiaceae bacterium]